MFVEVQKILDLMKNVSIRNYLLTFLLISFFLPWFSYGYITKSAFMLPFYIKELKMMIELFNDGSIVIPKELDYLYIIYLYPLLVALNLIWFSRLLVFITALVPLLIVGVAFVLAQVPFLNFLGWGAYSTFFLSCILLIFSFLPKRFY